MNKVILIGRLTKDPELKFTSGGKQVCSVTIAVNRDYKIEGQPDSDFINLKMWNKTAEACSKYTHKGSKVAVFGSLQIQSWDDKETGKKRSAPEVMVEKLEFLDNKPSDTTNRASSDNGFSEVPNEDDLPF